MHPNDGRRGVFAFGKLSPNQLQNADHLSYIEACIGGPMGSDMAIGVPSDFMGIGAASYQALGIPRA